MFTASALISLLIMIIVSAVFYWLGARMAKVPGATFGRAVAAAVLAGVVGLILQLVLSIMPGAGNILAFIVTLIVTLLIIKAVYKTTLGKAFLVWLFGFIAAMIVMAVLAALGLGTLMAVA